MFELALASSEGRVQSLGCWAAYFHGSKCKKVNPLLAKIRSKIGKEDFDGGAYYGMDGSVFSGNGNSINPLAGGAVVSTPP